MIAIRQTKLGLVPDFVYISKVRLNGENILPQNILKQELHTARGMFGRFLFQQYSLGDSFLKSSKDFIP